MVRGSVTYTYATARTLPRTHCDGEKAPFSAPISLPSAVDVAVGNKLGTDSCGTKSNTSVVRWALVWSTHRRRALDEFSF